MSEGSVRDDVREQVLQRMRELQQYVDEYEQLGRIIAAIDASAASSAAIDASAASSARTARLRRRRGATSSTVGTSARGEQALTLIRAHPGISVAALAEKMQIGTTYLYRLLPALERDGTVRKEGKGYHVAREAATSNPDAAETSQARAKASAGKRSSKAAPRRRKVKKLPPGQRQQSVLDAIRATPGVTVPEIGRQLDVDPTGLYRIVRRLEAQGLVRREGVQAFPAEASA